MENILVTGGAGFIGSHVVVCLHEMGFHPIILDDFSNSSPSVLEGLQKITGKSFKLYQEDCLNPEIFHTIFEEQRIDGVIHFAAKKAVGESVDKPLYYYENNVVGLINLLKAMDKHQVSNIVFSSSCTVYGEPEEIPVTEKAPKKPANSPYGNTKQIGEEILEDIVKSGSKLKAIALRYFNPIGAHPSGLIGELPIGIPSNLIPFITQTAIGKREMLTVFGDDYDTPDGTCIRDYIHVIDLAKAHVNALNLLEREADHDTSFEFINVGTGKGVTVLEAIQAFEDATGKTLAYKIGPRRSGDVEKIYANGDFAKSRLNWTAEYSIQDAMRDAWNWEKKLQER
jgi:UDP-glucose 4-epimerase